MKIRSVTLFITSGETQGFSERIVELGSKLSLSIESMFLSESVWSTRAALPPLGGQESPMKRASQLLDLDIVNYVSIGQVEDTHPALKEVADVAENGVFTSINLRSINNISMVENVLRKTCEEDPSNGSRISINVGENIVTPYFPSACNLHGEEGLAISLLYPSLLRNKLLSQFQDILAEVYASTERVGLKLSDSLGIKYHGIDVSLSPWMEESVAEIVEFTSGSKMPLPGTYSTIREINSLIENAVKTSGVKATGYNEIMLPVAEDNVLKERAAAGDVRLRDLVHLTSACVAGVDMVVLPDETPGNIVRGVFKDLFEINRVKGKTIGVRMLFAPGEPGETVKLKFFGQTPVIML
ncbi:MAG: DUF711 family protein [Thermoproteota archaeon]